ncbi:MAG: hypothetical protein HPY54_04565 [Chthonomonadetes bacterium]|nr:hypothetical protein [Chthonomonadetes bacterium]
MTTLQANLRVQTRRVLYTLVLVTVLAPLIVSAVTQAVTRGAEPVAVRCCTAVKMGSWQDFVSLFQPQARQNAEVSWRILSALRNTLGDVTACTTEVAGFKFSGGEKEVTVDMNMQMAKGTVKVKTTMVRVGQQYMIKRLEMCYP